MARASETATFLRTVSLFQSASEADLLALASGLDERRLRRGSILFRMGDAGDEMFVVRSGTVVISRPVSDRVEGVLARMTPGHFFGEMALFDDQRRSATVQAETDVVLLVLDRKRLTRLIESNPHAAAAFFHALVKVFSQRLRESGDKLAELIRWSQEATGFEPESR